jgi:hypothetical protein
MLDEIPAIYRDGAFIPNVPCSLPNESEVFLHVRPAAATTGPRVTDPAERRRILECVVDRMRKNPLPPETPPMTREWLHERG